MRQLLGGHRHGSHDSGRRVKAKMAQQLGHAIVLVEQAVPFPSRSEWSISRDFRTLGRKPEWLRGIARAASMAGSIQKRCGRSRSEAIDQLKELGGIGDFSAELILLRGAATRLGATTRASTYSAMKLAYDRAI